MAAINTVLNHINYKPKSIKFILNPGIVEVLIFDMFFHPDDHSGVTQKVVKNLFHQFENNYSVIIFNLMQFQLVVT